MHGRDRATKHEHQAQGKKDSADDFCFHVSYSICLLMFVCMFVCNNVVRRSIHHTELAKLYSPESDLLLS